MSKKNPIFMAAFGAALVLYSCNDAEFASTSAEARKNANKVAEQNQGTSQSTDTNGGSGTGGDVTNDDPNATLAIDPAFTNDDPFGTGTDTAGGNMQDGGSDSDTSTSQDGDPSTNPSRDPACGKGQPGLYGKVYKLAANTKALPAFETMTPAGRVDTIELNVPTRSWEAGFPSVENLTEWFGISFNGILEIPEDGFYTFRLNSDDGSKLYINNTLVLDNDGTHSTTAKDSKSVKLMKGKYSLKVDWFQGPRDQIALQLFWKVPGTSAFAIVPSAHLEHALDCSLKDLGTFP